MPKKGSSKDNVELHSTLICEVLLLEKHAGHAFLNFITVPGLMRRIVHIW